MGDTERPDFLPPIGELCRACNQIIAPAERDVIDGLHGHCFDRQAFNEIARDRIVQETEAVFAAYPEGSSRIHPDYGQLQVLVEHFRSKEGSSTNGRARRGIDTILRKLERVQGILQDISGQEALSAVYLQAATTIRRVAAGHLPPRRLSIAKRRYALAVGRVNLVKRRDEALVYA